MATRDTYTPQEWEDLPSENTPVSAARLEHIEQGIKDAMDNRALKEIYMDNSINLGRKEGTVAGNYSATSGLENEASGSCSYAGGFRTIARGTNQVVLGRYNIPDASGVYIVIVGGGSGEQNRDNIFALDSSGNGLFKGNVTCGVGGTTVSLYGLKEEINSRYNGQQSTINLLLQQVTGLNERVSELESNQNTAEAENKKGGETT